MLGASIFSDIFFVAFKLPNLFRRLFAEGAFTQAFLPSLIMAKKKTSFISASFALFFAIILVLCLLVFYFQHAVTDLIAAGFSDDKLKLAAPLVALNFWYLLFIFTASFFGVLLQYRHVFWPSAYSSILLNLGMIFALFFAADYRDIQIVYFLSYGVLIGGVAQILLHFYPLLKYRFWRIFRAGFSSIFIFMHKKKLHSRDSFLHSLKSFLKQFLSSFLGSTTAQFAAFIDTILASFLVSGSISHLYYANRIFQLPLALFAIATSMAIFPKLIRQIRDKNDAEANLILKNSFWFLLILLCACALGGIMLRNEIIFILFERGEFTRSDTLTTASIFGAYLMGLVPFGICKIFSLVLYARGHQGRAALFSGISLIFGTAIGAILMQFFGAFGLALGSSVGGFVLLLLTLKEYGFAHFINILFYKKGILALILVLFLEFFSILLFLHFLSLR